MLLEFPNSVIIVILQVEEQYADCWTDGPAHFDGSKLSKSYAQPICPPESHRASPHLELATSGTILTQNLSICARVGQWQEHHWQKQGR